MMYLLFTDIEPSGHKLQKDTAFISHSFQEKGKQASVLSLMEATNNFPCRDGDVCEIHGSGLACVSACVCVCGRVCVQGLKGKTCWLRWCRGTRGLNKGTKQAGGAEWVSSTLDLGESAILQSDLCSVENLSHFRFVFLIQSSMSYSDTLHHQPPRK